MPTWEQVDLPNCEFTGFATGPYWGATAIGSIAGEPALILVDRRGAMRQVRPGVDRPISSAVGEGDDYEIVVGRNSPAIRFVSLLREGHSDSNSAVSGGAERAWVVSPNEDTVVVFTRDDGALNVSIYDEPLVFEPPLRVVGDLSAIDLVVHGLNEAQVCVSGPLERADGRTALAWLSSSADGWTHEWKPIEATHIEFTVTDICDASEPNGSVVWLAGHHELQPVLQDSAGQLQPVPHTRLDAASPTVLLVDGINAVAVQSAQGPQLWTRRTETATPDDVERWLVEDLPPGRIWGGVRTESYGEGTFEIDDRLFLIIDGQLWHRPVSHPPLAL